MQGFQQSITNYYNQVPENWKAQSAKQFAAGFIIRGIKKKNFKSALQGGCAFSLADAIHQFTLPLLNKRPFARMLSKVTLRNFIILVAITRKVKFSAITTATITALKIVEFILKPYVSKEIFFFLSEFVSQYIEGSKFYEKKTVALKGALISSLTTCLFTKSLTAIQTHFCGPKIVKDNPNFFEKNQAFLENLFIQGGTAPLVYLQNKPSYYYPIISLPLFLMAFGVEFSKRHWEGIFALEGKCKVEDLTTEKVISIIKDLYNSIIKDLYK